MIIRDITKECIANENLLVFEMKENTNKAILINSAIMYARMAINTILALLTTRYALQALGVNDFGLFSLVGSIISFMGVFNTIMLSTCNRFLAVSIGKGDVEEINKTFNINLSIFIGCSLLFLIVGLPLGDYYIRNYINYDGLLVNVLLVFYFSVIGSVISTLATPYQGLLIAKERFFMFSLVDVTLHVFRFLVVLSLLYYWENKLLVYTVLQAFTIALPALINFMYSKKIFPNIVRFHMVKDTNAYKAVFKFSGWVSFGAFACVIRNQAAAVLVNIFFNTIMNTALGIANSLNNYVTLFANNLTQPIQPQITKSYASGNYERTNQLLVMSTKFSFMMMLLIGSPFFVSADWIVYLWLGQVPSYAVNFTILLIIDNIVMSFNSGLSLLLFADGRIALYQIVVNILRLLAVFCGYIILRLDFQPQALFYVYIFFSLLIVIATQWCLKKTINYNNMILVKKSYLPSLAILFLFLPVLLLPSSIHPLCRIVVAVGYLLILEFLIGLSKKEKNYIISKIK